MTQEDKELWLKDLCARVPYHPKGHIVNACTDTECDEWLTCATFSMFTSATNNCRLYLRPMSSITLEELEEYRRFSDHVREAECKIHIANYNQIDWLNRNHFDYRGLITKGLALEAPDGMYK